MKALISVQLGLRSHFDRYQGEFEVPENLENE
jgi:hypothetical protein